eukprot:c17693_g1_i2.p1 GENE.c17693_g1_i2~~c17693_g1_i2.p1  ORF type:complete len:520 (-),score=178.21 c17693_g1_i2:9-1568(-)
MLRLFRSARVSQVSFALRRGLASSNPATFSPKLTQTQPLPDDWDLAIFPHKSVGCDPELNWTLNVQHISPQKDAFRNLDAKGLIFRSEGKLSKEKAFLVDSVEGGEVKRYVYKNPDVKPQTMQKTPSILDPRCESVPSVRYKKIFEKLTEELCYSKNVFVHDWFIDEYPIRFITDDSTTALFLRNLTSVSEAPKEDIYRFAKECSIIYHSSNFDVTSSGIKLSSKDFSILDPSINTNIIGGTRNRKAIINAISTIVANNLEIDTAYGNESGPVFHCETLLNSKGDGCVAVFGGHSIVQDLNNLNSAHAHIYLQGKLKPVFNGIMREGSKTVNLVKGDLVENVVSENKKFSRVTSWQSPSTLTELPQVKAVILVVDDSSQTLPMLSKLDATQARHHFFYGTPGNPCYSPLPYSQSELSKKFVEFVQAQKADVYLVNKSSSKGGVDTAKNVISEISKGTVGKFESDTVLGLSVCTQLGSLGDLKSTTTSATVKKLGELRMKELLDFHTALTDDVVQGALPH